MMNDKVEKTSNFSKEKFSGLLARESSRRKARNRRLVALVLLSSFLMSLLGFGAGVFIFSQFYPLEKLKSVEDVLGLEEQEKEQQEPTGISERELSALSYEEAMVRAVEQVSPSVVSIVITKDVPVMERYYYNPFEDIEDYLGEDFDVIVPRYREKGMEKQEVGGGTGFIVSSDGLVLTNKHVVSDEEADYTVFTNEGERHEAEVLARDPFQDIAILKIEAENLPVVTLGDSDVLRMGQTVIAIGNVLGEFRNSVSRGVVSGLSRNVTASGGGMVEQLQGIIQTDAAINQGNSGGPLLNIKGEVVGINTAMALGAENVGFAIPINQAKRGVEQVKKEGEIVYPFLGVYYTMITPGLAEEHELPVENGAWIGYDGKGERTEQAISPGSPAGKIGLRQGDILLELDGQKLTLENTLAKVIRKYSPGDTVTLKVLRGGEEITLRPTLDRFEQ